MTHDKYFILVEVWELKLCLYASAGGFKKKKEKKKRLHRYE